MSETLQNWFTIYESELIWIGVISAVLFVVSILSLPWLLSLIPRDYFIKSSTFPVAEKLTPTQIILRPIVFIIRNIIGIILISLGFLMLFLPGQGILTILVGIFMMNFPAKNRLERWLIRQKGVLTSVNWLRSKNHHPPLDVS